MSEREARDITDLRKVARELSVLALHFSGGGSEMFKSVAGDQYADAVECRKRGDHRIDSVQRISDLNLQRVNARVTELEAALSRLLAHTDITSGNETEFERAVSAARAALSGAPRQ